MTVGGGGVPTLILEMATNTARVAQDMEQVKRLVGGAMDHVNRLTERAIAGLKGLAVGMLAALSVSAIKSFVDDVVKATGALSDMAERSGATVEGLSAIRSVAKLSSTDMGTVEAALVKLAKGMAGADDTSKGFGAALQKLGLSARDSAGNLKTTDQMYLDIALKLNQYADGAGKTAAAVELMGKAGAGQLSVMKDLAEVGEFQVKVTKEQADAADEYEKNLKRLSAAKSAVWKQIVVELIPAMDSLAKFFLELYKQTGGWRDQLSKLAQDGSIRQWANDAALGFAKFLDWGAKTFNQLDQWGTQSSIILANLLEFITRMASGGVANPLSNHFAKVQQDLNVYLTKLQGDAAKAQGYYQTIMGNMIAQQGSAVGAAKPNLNFTTGNDEANKKFNEAILKQMDLLKTYGALERAVYEAGYAIQKDLLEREQTDVKASFDMRLITERQYIEESNALQIKVAEGNLARLTKERQDAVRLTLQMQAEVAKIRGTDDAANAKRAEGEKKVAEQQKVVVKLLGDERIAAEAVASARQKEGTELTVLNNRQTQALLEMTRAAEDFARAQQDQLTAMQLSVALTNETSERQAAIRLQAEALLKIRDLELQFERQITDEKTKQADPAKIAAIVAQREKELKALKETYTAMQKIADAAAEAADFKKFGDTLGDTLTKAFGVGGEAAGKMVRIFTDGIAQQSKAYQTFIAQRTLLENQAADDHIASDRKVSELQDQFNQESLARSAGMYGDMASAAAGFFDKSSSGYRTLMAVSQAFHAVELALTIANNVQKGITAVLNQANGDPYSAFARMAAMAAVVAGLGVAIGSVAGGGGSSGGQSAAQIQKQQGTGSVLGDSSAKSRSIENALQEIQRIDQIGLTYTQDMRDILLSIDRSMAGLANLFARATGVTTGSNLGINTGTVRNHQDPLVGWMLPNQGTLPGWLDIGGIASALQGLWGKTSTSITDAGIQIAGTIRELLQGQGVSQYANVHTDSSSFFGLVHSSSDSTVTGALDPAVIAQFKLTINGIVDSVEAGAKALGIWFPAMDDAIRNFVVDLGKVSLDGLKGQELEDAISAIFSKLGDDITKAIMPTELLDKFQRVGEGAYQTLIRIATENEVATRTFSALGLSVAGVGTAGIEARVNLVELMGGVENFSKQTGAYFASFFTPAEQLAQSGKDLSAEFARLGLTMPTTSQGFRDIVSGLDLTTENGQRLFTALMSINQPFAEFIDTVVGADGKLHTRAEVDAQHTEFSDRLAIQQNIADPMQGATEQQLQRQRELAGAYDEASRVLLRAIYAQEDYNAGVTIAVEGAQARIDLEKELFDVSHSESEVLANNRSLRMAELAAKEQELHLLPGSLQAIQAQIDKQKDLTEARQKEVDALKVTADLQGRLGVLRGEFTQQELDRAREWQAASNETDKALLTEIYREEDLADAAKKASDALGTQTDLWNQFATDEQKLARATQEVNAGFASLGVAVPQSAEQFADLVASIDPATEAGQKFLDFLKLIAPAFQETLTSISNLINPATNTPWVVPFPTSTPTTPVDNSAQILDQKLEMLARLYELTGNTAGAAAVLEQQHQIALERLDPSLRDLQKQLWAAEKAAAAAAKALAFANAKQDLQIELYRALGNEQAAVDLEHKKIIDQINTEWGNGSDQAKELIALYQQLWQVQAQAGETGNAWVKQLQDWLRNMRLDTTSPLTPTERFDTAQSQYIEDLLKSQQGDADARSRFTQDADAYLREALAFYGRGSTDYNAIYQAIVAQTQGLIDQGLGPSAPVTLADVTTTLQSGQQTAKEQSDTLIAEIQRLNAKVDALTATATRGNEIAEGSATRQEEQLDDLPRNIATELSNTGSGAALSTR